MALNSDTGAVTLTSDLADLTDDITLVLTAMAQDHGEPRLNSTGPSDRKLEKPRTQVKGDS